MVLVYFNNYDCCDKYVWICVVIISVIMVNYYKNNLFYRVNVMVRFICLFYLLCY